MTKIARAKTSRKAPNLIEQARSEWRELTGTPWEQAAKYFHRVTLEPEDDSEARKAYSRLRSAIVHARLVLEAKPARSRAVGHVALRALLAAFPGDPPTLDELGAHFASGDPRARLVQVASEFPWDAWKQPRALACASILLGFAKKGDLTIAQRIEAETEAIRKAQKRWKTQDTAQRAAWKAETEAAHAADEAAREAETDPAFRAAWEADAREPDAREAAAQEAETRAEWEADLRKADARRAAREAAAREAETDPAIRAAWE